MSRQTLNQWVTRLKEADPKQARDLLEEFNQLYSGNGVVYIRNPKGDGFERRQGVSYLKLSNAYTPTLCYFHKWQVFRYVGWGDALEMMENSDD